jgi:hypothetical protein
MTDQETDLKDAATEASIQLSPIGDGRRHDWVQLKDVKHIYLVGQNFLDARELDAAVEYIQRLTNRGHPGTESPESAASSASSLSRISFSIKAATRSMLQSRRISRLRYPGLVSLAVHALFPQPGQGLPEAIITALKIFVSTHRREAKAGSLTLLLRPSPGDEELEWFKNYGVNCILTTGRDNRRFVDFFLHLLSLELAD